MENQPQFQFVEQAKDILEKASMNSVAKNLGGLPEPDDFDKEHEKWRNKVITAAKAHGLSFTHGLAAKLINIYLKSIFVCGNDHDNNKVKAIHPPIDSVLLDALHKHNVSGKKSEWQAARKARWSKLTSAQYQAVIEAIKSTISKDKGLWEIEEFWKGYQ